MRITNSLIACEDVVEKEIKKRNWKTVELGMRHGVALGGR